MEKNSEEKFLEISVIFFYSLVRNSILLRFMYLSSQGKERRIRSSVLLLHCSKLHTSEEIKLNEAFLETLSLVS